MRVTVHSQHIGLSSLQTAAADMARAQKEVASGRRVDTPSDDPIATRRIVSERAELAALDAYEQSATDAYAPLMAADTALGSVVEQLTRALTSTAAVRTSVVSADARATYAEAIRGVRADLVTQVNMQISGRPLFGGSAPVGPAYAQVGGSWVYQGEPDTVQVDVQRGRQVTVAFDGRALLQGADADNILNALDALASAVEAGDAAGIAAGADAIERAQVRATRLQGHLGADQRGVDDATGQVGLLRLASEARRARVQDADLASAISRMTQADMAYRAAVGAVGSAERASLLDYLR